VQCIVHVFLETFAHKSHRYISRYPEIFEKKSRLIVRKIRYQLWRFLITDSTDQTLVERQSIYNASKHKLARLTIEMLCQRIIDIYG